MKQGLSLRVSQHLALTPQLQQSIRLLQLSTLELHQEVEQMLEQNPFLVVEADGGSSYESPAERTLKDDRAADRSSEGERERDEGGESGGSGEGEAAVAEVSGQEFGTTEREDWENGTEREDFDGIRETPSSSAAGASDDDFDPQERNTASLSPTRKIPAASVPAKPRKSRLGRFTYCTGKRTGWRSSSRSTSADSSSASRVSP